MGKSRKSRSGHRSGDRLSFSPSFSARDLEQHVKREKEKARRLKKTDFWHRKIQKEGRCSYCQKPLTASQVTLDHIVPLSLGGRSTRGNVAISCRSCNVTKSARTPIEWQYFHEGSSSDLTSSH